MIGQIGEFGGVGTAIDPQEHYCANRSRRVQLKGLFVIGVWIFNLLQKNILGDPSTWSKQHDRETG